MNATTPAHVLFIFDQLRSLNGGAERSLLRLTQTLPPERYRCSIVTFWQPENTDFLREFPCPVYLLPIASTVSISGMRAGFRLREIIRSENVAIVQTFFPTSDLWGGIIAKLSGCPVLISSRRDMGFLRRPKHRLAYRALHSLFDHIHAVSEAVRLYTIQEDRADPSRVVTIPNGVEVYDRFTDSSRAILREQFGIPASAPLVLGVGTIRRVRGYETFIKTARAVCNRYPNIIFGIFGLVADEAYRRELEALAFKLDMQHNFRFLGYVEQVGSLLSIGDIYCHLSFSDGLSNALLEAMAAGLPSVISRAGGNPEVVRDGHTGFTVPPGDEAAAAEKIIYLLDHPEVSSAVGEAARMEVRSKFTAEAMGRRFASLYDELLQKKPARRFSQIEPFERPNT